jgi:hypothetical protein
MWYFVAAGRYIPESSPANEWGEWTTFVEVGDEQIATRQICEFKNGSILCYGRDNPRDDFGYLVGLKFSLKPKWQKFFPDAEVISANEFEDRWKRSLISPNLKNGGNEA